MDCEPFCATIQLGNSTAYGFSQHSCWHSLKTGTQNKGGDQAKKPARYTDDTNWGDNVFLGCRGGKTVLPRAIKQLKNTEGQTLEKEEQSRQIAAEWVANESNISLKNSIEEFTKTDEIHYVILYQQNQGYCRYTNGAKHRSIFKKPETEMLRPTVWCGAINSE